MMQANRRRFWRYQVDAGWAWVVCFTSFFVHCVTFGTIQSFGTLFISLQNDFNSGESATAWVGSMGYGFLFVIGPLTAALCEHFGCRVMACTGSVLTTTALLATSFASNISSMYFTFGMLWGTGGSFLYFSGLLILRFYFNTNLSFANGITMTGAGFGTLIFNVLLQELDAKYGWRGGMRVLSVFSALTFLCGCTYIPPPIDYLAFERPSLLFRLKRLIDPRPWRDPAFPMWVLSLSFILFAYFFPYTYLVKLALTLGIPVSQGALLLGYLSISAIFGKLLCGRLADLPRVRRLYIFVTSATILSVSSMCVTAAKTYHALLAYTIVAGFFDGCFVLTVPLITQDIVGKDLMAKAIGSMYGVVAFPLTLGPPVLGELYKTTGSFTTAFFVSACFVLVGVSLTYIVQRIRPDLVRKQEPAREEVIPSPSIHSASVVDTLSGLCVTPEPHLSVSHLDPIEIGSYQRFDSFRPENPRTTITDPVQGRLANKTEIEAVYKQAVDNLSTTGVSGHIRTGSDANSITKSNVSARSHSGSVFSSSLLSSTETTGNSDSPSGLQITLGETKELPKSADSCATLVNTNNEQLSDEEEVKIPDTGGTMVQENDQGIHETSVPKHELSLTGEQSSITATPLIDTQTSLEANCTEEDEKVSVAQLGSDFPVPFTEDQPLLRKPLDNKETDLSGPVTSNNIRDTAPEVELVKLPPPPESNRKRRVGPNAQDEEDDTGEDDENAFKSTSDRVPQGFLDTQNVPPDGETFQDSTIPLLRKSCSSDKVPDAVQEETLDVNEVLELVRIPPPPAIPRTGQLVALENEATDDLRESNFTEEEGTSVGHASLSEVQLDACQNDVPDRKGVEDCYSAKEVSTSQRKEGLHHAIIDQLNLLSERLEAVAARQIQEEEQINENEDTQDQRPVFSPALQSLPLTPLYSANHSVPLTPVRAWSGSVTNPAPTPLQTPPSAFHTTAPTPISTPRLASQSVSGVFNVSSEIQTPSAVQDANDVFDVCSPSSSQGAMSRHRSRCSSFSEVGQEYMLNEWSHLDQREPQGSIDVSSSKQSSGTNSSVSNSARSLGDLNSVTDPIDVVDNTASHGGQLNSPEDTTDDQELELELPMCLLQQPENPFQQTYLNSNQTEQQPSQAHDWTYNVEDTTLSMETTSDKEQFRNERREYMPQQAAPQQFNNTDIAEESIHQPSSITFTPDHTFTGYEHESANIPQQPSPQDDLSHKDIFNSTASNPQAAYFIVDPIQQSCMDPSPVESNVNPFLDSDQAESISIHQQNPFQQNEVCSLAGVPDEPQSFITSIMVAVPMQQTYFDSSPLELQSKSFLEQEPSKSVDDSQEISHQSSIQQHDTCSSDSGPDELQNICEISDEIVPQPEQLLPVYQPASETAEQCHLKAKEMDIDTISSDSYGSTKLDSSPQTSELSYQHDHTENLGDQQILTEQILLMTTELGTRSSPEESKDDHAEPVFISLDSTKEENDRTLEKQNSWTTFTGSEEALIFEMDTDGESSPESSAKVESDSTIASTETKHENKHPHVVTANQNILFPPLQIFSDMVNSTLEASRPSVYKKLPPPPRQSQRKRTDVPVCSNSHKVDSNHSQIKQEMLEPEERRLEERHDQVSSIQKEPVTHESGGVESHHVSSDGDLSATLNSVSEIESDTLSASTLAEPAHDQCSSKLGDNSITDIVCQEFEFIEGKDVLTMNEELDDANLDGNLAKASIHDDTAPLLMQSEESIQYLNLRDLPEDFHVLQKRPSTTSSTDDSSTSSTSTDSSLSETEMPQYTKLHEDFNTLGHG